MGKSVNLPAFKRRLRSLWRNTDGFSILDQQNGFYLVSFWNTEDSMMALKNGPWILFCLMRICMWNDGILGLTPARIGSNRWWCGLSSLGSQYIITTRVSFVV